MINQKQIYDAFRACKQIYGIDRVHVNLIAKQLGVLAIDVITYINGNPTLVDTRFEAANSGFVNPDTANYPGVYVTGVSSVPFISTVSRPKVGETGATIVLALSGDTFHETAAGTTTNYTIDAGTTGLTLSTATRNSTTQVTLVFTGTVGLGTLSIKAKAAALTGTVASDIVYLDMTDPAFTASTLAGVNADIIALESDVDGLETAVGTYAGENDIATDLAALQLLNEITTTTLDLTLTSDSPAALPITHSHVIVTANPEATPGKIALPAATGSGLKITVVVSPSIMTGIEFQPDDTDTINEANDTFLVPNKNSSTLIDIAEGKWLLI